MLFIAFPDGEECVWGPSGKPCPGLRYLQGPGAPQSRQPDTQESGALSGQGSPLLPGVKGAERLAKKAKCPRQSGVPSSNCGLGANHHPPQAQPSRSVKWDGWASPASSDSREGSRGFGMNGAEGQRSYGQNLGMAGGRGEGTREKVGTPVPVLKPQSVTVIKDLVGGAREEVLPCGGHPAFFTSLNSHPEPWNRSSYQRG